MEGEKRVNKATVSLLPSPPLPTTLVASNRLNIREGRSSKGGKESLDIVLQGSKVFVFLGSYRQQAAKPEAGALYSVSHDLEKKTLPFRGGRKLLKIATSSEVSRR